MYRKVKVSLPKKKKRGKNKLSEIQRRKTQVKLVTEKNMVGDTHKLKIIEEDVHQKMKSQMEHTHFLTE